MGKINLEKIVSLENKLHRQATESDLDKNKSIIIKKPYLIPQINELLVNAIITSGSSPSDFDAFTTSS